MSGSGAGWYCVCVPQAFWQRYQELPDWEKVIKNIERGEQKIQRQADIMRAIHTKLERYKNPWQELKVRAGRPWGPGCVPAGCASPGGRWGGGRGRGGGSTPCVSTQQHLVVYAGHPHTP
jgi:hypothetical protein